MKRSRLKASEGLILSIYIIKFQYNLKKNSGNKKRTLLTQTSTEEEPEAIF